MPNLKIEPRFNSFKQVAAFVTARRLSAREAVVVLSRHGQTVFNETHKLPAWVPDIDRLSSKGEYNARRLQEPLSLLPISWVASSDIARAIHTAQLALPGKPITPLFCLRDFDYGQLGGITYEGPDNQFEKTHPQLSQVFKNDRRAFAAPGGEKYIDFEQRIREGFLNEVLPDSLGKVSFIVSHRAVLREIVCGTVLNSNVNLTKLPIDGTSITVVHLQEDGSLKLLLLNYTEHLKD